MKKTPIKIITQAVSSAIVLAAAGQAAAFDFTAGGVEASVYGYARLNASYDIDENIATTTRAGSFGAINTGDDSDEVTGHFGADAVQSRIGVKAMLPNDVRINVEGDFRNGVLRLRHAYGEYMGVLAGQTWSNFTSFVGYTSTLDFDGLAGHAGYQGRAAQVRYTTGPLSVSLEDPQTSILGAPADSFKEGLPTLTARYESATGPISYSVAGLVHQVEFDNGAQDDSAFGAGAFGALGFKATDALTLNAVLSYSNGANSYIWRTGDAGYYGEDAYVDGNGDLETVSSYAVALGASLKAGPQGTINVSYGMTEMDWDDAQDDGLAVGDKHETNTNAFINYQYAPTANVMYGVEYGYFMVDEVDGDDGDASRILFAAQYSF